MSSLILYITQSSRQRRLYHRLIIEAQPSLDFEVITSRSIADALLQLSSNQFEAIILDDTLPIFEVGLFVDLLNKKETYTSIAIGAIGFQNQQHIFPKRTLFFESIHETVPFLSRLCGTL